MEDPKFIVPYHDPYDTPLSPSFFNMPNPTLSDLTNDNNIPRPGGSTLPQQQNHHGFQEGNYPQYFDPMIQDDSVDNNFSIEGVANAWNFEANPLLSQVHVDQGDQPATNDVPGSQDFNDVMTFSQWPQPLVPFSCSCCIVLREIVHTNGFNFAKLEIHGRPGMITHAVQHPVINVDYSSSSNIEYQMIDFCRKSIEDVKNFLAQYCVGQTSAGYYILQDPLSSYYEALCIGMEWIEELGDDTDDLSPNSDDDNEQEGDKRVGKGRRRACYSAQRNRAGKMTLEDLTDYLHLPIEEAAKRVNLCPTVLKKICRKAQLGRWPYRKIRSIAKMISALKRALESNNDEMSRARIQGEISRLEAKIREECVGLYPTALVIP